MNRSVLRWLAVFAALVTSIASAQDYPTKPVRLVVPYPAGSSSNDIIARYLAQRLSGALGQQVLVENRPGNGGNVGEDQLLQHGAVLPAVLLRPTDPEPAVAADLSDHFLVGVDVAKLTRRQREGAAAFRSHQSGEVVLKFGAQAKLIVGQGKTHRVVLESKAGGTWWPGREENYNLF